MRVGIVPVMGAHTGGIYQYSFTMLAKLYEGDFGYDFHIFTEDRQALGFMADEREGWTVHSLYPFSVRRLLKRGARSVLGEERMHEIWERKHRKEGQEQEENRDPDVILLRPDLGRRFTRFEMDYVLYPFSTTVSFESGVPYVMAIHDLQHRLQPEFPEVTADGEAEAREYLYRNGTRYALMILVDSEVGKEDVMNSYGEFGITEDRVKVLPFLPASYLEVEATEEERQRVRLKYSLPERYLFYPAQFWPHKNHVRIVEALGILKREHHLTIPIVFCGSHVGRIRSRQFEAMMNRIHDLDLEAAVQVSGYLPDEDMAALYSGAVGLIFPTFFGPTNIPVLEAWALGCPVLTSGIRGIREQAGDAALLVDPNSVQEMAEGIRKLWEDDALRRRLIDLGRKRLASYTPEDYAARLSAILREAKERVDSESGSMSEFIV